MSTRLRHVRTVHRTVERVMRCRCRKTPQWILIYGSGPRVRSERVPKGLTRVWGGDSVTCRFCGAAQVIR